MSKDRILILFVFILFTSSSYGQQKVEGNPFRLTVISYNIWNGFDWGKDTSRKEKVVELIKSQKPDVLAL